MEINELKVEYFHIRAEFIAFSDNLDKDWCKSNKDCINCPFACEDCIIGLVEAELKELK